MPEPGTGSSNTRWISALLAGLLTLAFLAWLLRAPASEQSASGAASQEAREAATGDTGSALPRVASGGRLQLDAAALPDDAPLALALDLEDDARADGEHAARVVSADGRRLDLKALPLAGAGSGLRLEIEPAFLTPGRYMIEVETEEHHPLRIRRYVLEIR